MSDDAVTRSEEELRIGTEWRAIERVRIRRRVVEEEVSVQVVIRREELVVEREPVAEADSLATGGPAEDRDEDELVILLREERPLVTTEVVPRERVRVWRERVVGEVSVVEDNIRRERIELERDAGL